MTDEFGHWLAGFTDGEGCFCILRHHHARDAYYCTFQICLRADDTAILEEIHREVGVGTLTARIAPMPSAIRNAKPQTRWQVASRAGAGRIVDLFEKYPLRSKKARDFDIWKQAVRLWLAQNYPSGQRYPQEFYDAMAVLKAELARVREYETMGEAAELPALPVSPQETLWEEAA